MEDVVDLLGRVIEGLVGVLSGSVGASVYNSSHALDIGISSWECIVKGDTRTDVDGINLNHGAVGLVGNAIDLLDGEGVREELVLGGRDDVLDVYHGLLDERTRNPIFFCFRCTGLKKRSPKRYTERD